MGKYMQSQQNTCKLDGLKMSMYWTGQKMNVNQMIYRRVSAVEVHKNVGNGVLREEEVIWKSPNMFIMENRMIYVGVSLKQVSTIPVKMTAIQMYFK